MVGAFSINETMLFEADHTGKILSWSELACTKPALKTEQWRQ
jgi:hypothetical protein